MDENKKRIWIDLDNSPHVPFFDPIIPALKARGCTVFVTARNCFQVCDLARLHHMPFTAVGRHYGKNKLLKMFGLAYRALQLVPTALKGRPDLALSHGSRSQLLAARMLGVQVVMIYDYEYTRHLPFIRPNWVIVPDVIADTSIELNPERVLKYPGIKEDVYVPSFRPTPGMLDDLAVNKDAIVVTIRPPATEAHYHSPVSDQLFTAVIDWLGTRPEVCMVLLPRNERQADFIRHTWATLLDTRRIIIPDKVVDGLNLIWHSDLVVSGGGTLNREAAALGVPVYSIFGGTIGAVDRHLADQGRLTLLRCTADFEDKICIRKWRRPALPGWGAKPALCVIVDAISGIVGGNVPAGAQAQVAR